MDRKDNYIHIGNDCCLWKYDGCEKPYTVCDIEGNKAEMTEDEFNRLALESSIAKDMINMIEQSETGQYGTSYCNYCGQYISGNSNKEHRDDCDYINFVSKISSLLGAKDEKKDCDWR